MLPKRFRLSKEEFKQVMDGGQMASGKVMGILIGIRAKGQGLRDKPKAGIIVSKKLSNKAVVRNKLKRRLRAALQNVLPELSDIHLVVLPNRRAIGTSVKELENEIKLIVQK